MNRTSVAFLVAATVLFRAAPVGAQICAGFPTVDSQYSLGGSLDFPSGGNSWGVDGSADLEGLLGVFASFDTFSPEGSGGSQNSYSIGAAATLLSATVGGGADSLSICPTARLGYADFGAGSVIEVPIGVGIGTRVSVSPLPVMPYAIPQFVVSRYSYDNEQIGSSTEFDFGFRGGVLLGFGPLFVGPEFTHVFREGTDPVLGIRGGIRL
jgi:hypothetical protein